MAYHVTVTLADLSEVEHTCPEPPKWHKAKFDGRVWGLGLEVLDVAGNVSAYFPEQWLGYAVQVAQ